MQTTSLLLLWVMGRIKGLHRGYAVSYCKTVKDCIALACTDGSIPISYTLFITRFAQPTTHQRQSSTVCRGRTFHNKIRLLTTCPIANQLFNSTDMLWTSLLSPFYDALNCRCRGSPFKTLLHHTSCKRSIRFQFFTYR
jgi:hypothetical protein